MATRERWQGHSKFVSVFAVNGHSRGSNLKLSLQLALKHRGSLPRDSKIQLWLSCKSWFSALALHTHEDLRQVVSKERRTGAGSHSTAGIIDLAAHRVTRGLNGAKFEGHTLRNRTPCPVIEWNGSTKHSMVLDASRSSLSQDRL